MITTQVASYRLWFMPSSTTSGRDNYVTTHVTSSSSMKVRIAPSGTPIISRLRLGFDMLLVSPSRTGKVQFTSRSRMAPPSTLSPPLKDQTVEYAVDNRPVVAATAAVSSISTDSDLFPNFVRLKSWRFVGMVVMGWSLC